MKIIFGAIALVIAAPVAAQTAPAANPHADHQGMDHSQHKQGEHDCKACCEKMKGKDGKMECTEKTEAKKTAPASTGHEGHGGHAH